MNVISDAGLNLIKTFEGIRLQAYQDQRGIWTIGDGHTAGVYAGETITAAQADDFLRLDLGVAETTVNHMVTATLTQDQFDALVSLVFNIGSGNFAHSTLLKTLNEGDTAGAAEQFLMWDHANGVVDPGLLRRREAERAMFLG